jgi:putative ABC transport system permease protein
MKPFVAVALLILALAVINYVNLTTARSTLRSKEVILKKVMGSGKNLLRFQFISESTLITFISFILAFTIIQLILPKFNQLSGVGVSLGEYFTPAYWSMLIMTILLIGFISGFYPAMMLTSFSSVSNVRGQSLSGTGGTRLRHILLTFQLSISMVLIIGLITNLRQLNFVKNVNLGFDKEHVILINHPHKFEDEVSYRKTFKDQLLLNHHITKVGSTNRRIGYQEPGHSELEINGTEKYFQFSLIDPDYLDAMGIDMVEGRNFSWDRPGDRSLPLTDDSIQFKTFPIIVNETAARTYWDESPVGKFCAFSGPRNQIKLEIIGVFKDFHLRSMHYKVEPMFFYCRWYSHNMLIRVSSENLPTTIQTIEKEWKNIYGAEPFAYSFLDETYEQQYQSDDRAATIIGYFTVLAIIIACMGLFALSSFMAVRRTKEIGIRKALGASSKTIFVMLSREYIKWILLSAVIASPIAWYAMNKWLETFAYRIELGPWVFIIAAVIALAIGLITVGWQALKSAVANPVEALRYE